MAKKTKVFDEDDYEWTKEDFARARPLREVDPALAEWSRKKKLGRPAKADPTVNLTIRVRESYLPKLRKIPRYQTMITKLIHTWVDA